MRLLSLKSDQAGFRPVRFNRSGLSFVIAEKKSADTTGRNRKKTYNGVGKSLMFEIIHFCLGSSANDAFARHLPDWTFYLTVEVEDVEHVIARTTTKANEVYLDTVKHTVPQIREWLLDAGFDVPPGFRGLTFRSLISPFIRSGRAAYEKCEYADGGDVMNPYYSLVRNAFLLDLDLHLAQEKHAARSRQTSLKKTMKQLESDPLFADLLSDDRGGMELANLREQETALDTDLKAFRVAKNYESIQKDADGQKKRFEELRRESVKTAEAIAQIDRSLQTNGDIDAERVRAVYAEAMLAFPAAVKKQIDDVLKFQSELQSRRVFRLTADRQVLVNQQQQRDASLKELSGDIQQKLQYLGTHVALDEYLAVSEELNELRQRIAKLEASQEQRTRVNNELLKIDRDLAEQSIKTGEYLTKAKPLIDEADQMFRKFARTLYGNRTSGLQISSDNGENMLRYQIQPHISGDAAEGINEAKIFCYDLMILALGRGHDIEFLCHDSTLFSPVDHRQRFYMLQLAERITRELDVQYIATLNEHDISSMQPNEESALADYDVIFDPKNVVLRLTDQSPKDRLLGREIDMDYTQKKKKTSPKDDEVLEEVAQ